MYKLWAAIKKDVRVLLRDKVGLILMFAMPILLVIVVTAIQSSTFQLVNKNKLPLIIANRDTGKASKQFVEAVDHIGMFKLINAASNETDEQIKISMHDHDALLSVIIPSDFSVKVADKAKSLTGKAMNSFGLEGDTTKKQIEVSPLTVYYQPVMQESYRLSVQGALMSALQIVESRETLRKLYFSINNAPLPAKLENELLSNQAKINQVPVSISGSSATPNASQHNVPAWTVFAMFFITVSLGGSVVREKLSGSFIRLKTLPTSFVINLVSKQISYMAVTILQAAVIFALGLWLFPHLGLPILNPPSDILALIVVSLLCGWCAVSFAICIGVYAQTQEQANSLGAISIVILAAIGGLMVPIFAMPAFFKTLAAISPLHWCLEAYYKLFLEGGRLADVIPNLIPLLIITLIFQLVAFIGLKRKNLI